jgi:hypothetical protein
MLLNAVILELLIVIEVVLCIEPETTSFKYMVYKNGRCAHEVTYFLLTFIYLLLTFTYPLLRVTYLLLIVT